VEWIIEANNIQDPNVIQVGQKLIIPRPTPVSKATPTETVPPTATPTPNVPPQLEIVSVSGRGAPEAEVVVITNRGRSVSLKGWTLRDAQGNAFVFPDLYLGTGAEVRVHTGKGENTPLHLYWNRETAVWQENGDTAILADDRGVVYASKPLD
jgi:LysM repeat protein